MLDYRLVGQKIREVRQAQNLSLRELADMMGYNHVTILGWEKGRRRISLDDLSRVSKALGVDIEYFLDAKRTLDDTVVKRSIVREKLADILGVIYVPLVGKVQAGKPVLAVESIEDQIPVPQALAREGETVFALRVVGDSMISAGIQEGDIAIIRKQDFLDYPGQIAVVIVGEEGTLKRVCQSEDLNLWPLEPHSSVGSSITWANVAQTQREQGVSCRLVTSESVSCQKVSAKMNAKRKPRSKPGFVEVCVLF